MREGQLMCVRWLRVWWVVGWWSGECCEIKRFAREGAGYMLRQHPGCGGVAARRAGGERELGRGGCGRVYPRPYLYLAPTPPTLGPSRCPPHTPPCTQVRHAASSLIPPLVSFRRASDARRRSLSSSWCLSPLFSVAVGMAVCSTSHFDASITQHGQSETSTRPAID